MRTLPLRALLVDDDQDIRLIAELSLSRIGNVSVISAASGEEALACWDLHPFDVILMDVMLPGLDGPDTVAELRRRGCDVPVVYMTAKGGPEVEQQLLDTGALGVITKPFEPARLAAEIRMMLEWSDDASAH